MAAPVAAVADRPDRGRGPAPGQDRARDRDRDREPTSIPAAVREVAAGRAPGAPAPAGTFARPIPRRSQTLAPAPRSLARATRQGPGARTGASSTTGASVRRRGQGTARARRSGTQGPTARRWFPACRRREFAPTAERRRASWNGGHPASALAARRAALGGPARSHPSSDGDSDPAVVIRRAASPTDRAQWSHSHRSTYDAFAPSDAPARLDALASSHAPDPSDSANAPDSNASDPPDAGPSGVLDLTFAGTAS